MRRLLVLFFLVAAVLPVRAAEKVTVEQLENALAAGSGKGDHVLAKQLGGLELNERLSAPKLAKIQAGMPGKKSRLALLALADASAFLQLPTVEILAAGPPDAETQKLILSRAAAFLAASLYKLPDFFAEKTTTRFHDRRALDLSETAPPVIREGRPFQFLDSFSNRISYRNGQEVDESNGKQGKIIFRPAGGMVSWGAFGPLLSIAMTNISEGKVEWGHWEQRETDQLAVFQYSIPKEKSTYTVKYCCFETPNTELHSFQSTPPFHGEISIDPATGAIYRLVLMTDLAQSGPVFRVDSMVEYDSVEIGGRAYICPRKSVTVTEALTQVIRHRACKLVADDCWSREVTGSKYTAISDTEYDSYHVFTSESRILPTASTGKEDMSPPGSPVTPPPVAPGP
jgi:hypothetical protein